MGFKTYFHMTLSGPAENAGNMIETVLDHIRNTASGDPPQYIEDAIRDFTSGEWEFDGTVVTVSFLKDASKSSYYTILVSVKLLE